MTCILPAVKFVTRHSYTPDNLYPDWQKPRRASLLPAVYQNPALNKKKSILVTASCRSATLTEFYRRAVSTNTSKIELASRRRLLNFIMIRIISIFYRDLAIAPSFLLTFSLDNNISATLTNSIASQFYRLITTPRTRANGLSINIS